MMSNFSNETDDLRESFGDSGIDLNNALIVESTFSDVLNDHTLHRRFSQESVIAGSHKQNWEYASILEGDGQHHKKQDLYESPIFVNDKSNTHCEMPRKIDSLPKSVRSHASDFSMLYKPRKSFSLCPTLSASKWQTSGQTLALIQKIMFCESGDDTWPSVNHESPKIPLRKSVKSRASDRSMRCKTQKSNFTFPPLLTSSWRTSGQILELIQNIMFDENGEGALSSVDGTRETALTKEIFVSRERKSCRQTQNAEGKTSTTKKVDESHLLSVASMRKNFSPYKHVGSSHLMDKSENFNTETLARSEVIIESHLKPVAVTRKIFCPVEKEEKQVLKTSDPVPKIMISMVSPDDSLIRKFKSQCHISEKSPAKTSPSNNYESNPSCFGVKIRSPVAEYIKGRAVVKNSQGRKIFTNEQAKHKK